MTRPIPLQPCLSNHEALNKLSLRAEAWRKYNSEAPSMAKKKNKPTSSLLSRKRQPGTQQKASLSSKATRSLINRHHQLHKKRSQAIARGDFVEVASLEAALEADGGLQAYQLASIQGQSLDRGGDSSKVLVDWLEPHSELKQKLQVLEIGALSTQNAISLWPLAEATRIDLNSQNTGILKQDFMERPLPRTEDEKFDCLSLSLVLNYVPDATGRGEMLKRTRQFLRGPTGASLLVPCLFLVLPAPCVLNSRYLTKDLLQEMMASLGFMPKFEKTTTKLVYYLWVFSGMGTPGAFKKTEINPGKNRNNFAIILDE